MIMYKLLIAGCMQLVAISYVTSDIAKSSYMPLSFRSMASTDYNDGVEYQVFDDRFPRSDDELFNLTDPFSATYDYQPQTIPIRITGDAVDIPLAKFADGLDKDFNFENSSQSESTDDIRNFVKINTPPMKDPHTLLTELLKQTTSKMIANTTTSETPTTGTPATTKSKIPTISKSTISTATTKRTITTTPTKSTNSTITTTSTNSTITTTPTITTNRTITTTPPKTTNSTITTTPTKTTNRTITTTSTETIPITATKINMVEKEIISTPKKVLEGAGRSFHIEDDVISSNILLNGFEANSSYLQRENFERYQKKLDDLSPSDDDELQKVDEPAQIQGDKDEDRSIYEGWLSDGTPVQCKKSVVPFLNCKLEMFHVGELPFFYYGLTLLNSKLADKVCPCPMPRLEPDCVNTAHRVARYMEHICHAYLRM